MPSKLVIRRQKSAQAVIAAARTHGPLAAAAIGEVTDTVKAPAEAPPNIALLLELCARRLEGAIGQVIEADDAHESELADDAGPRRQRDALMEQLGADLLELKEIAVGLLGRAALVPLQLTGRMPRDPVVLGRHVTGVIEALRTAPLPPSRVPAASFPAQAWAARLEANALALSSTIADMAREAREAEATLVAKHRALDEYDRTFGDVATLVSALLRMGGEVELADRVRPSTRRPGQTHEIAERDDEPDSDARVIAPAVPASAAPAGA